MNRELALKVVLVVVGLLFLASGYPLMLFLRQDPGTAMLFTLYVTLGVFLLIAVRSPSAHRSLIAFAAWSSFAHAAVMGFQAFQGMIQHVELIGVGGLIVVGILLLALAPPRQSPLATRH